MIEEKKIVAAKDLTKDYFYSEPTIRAILCRPEFAKFEVPYRRSPMRFYNTPEFRATLMDYIKKRRGNV